VGAIVALSDTATGGVWSVSNGNAGITATGILSGLAGGTTTVSYTVTKDGCSATATLPVKIIPLSECSALRIVQNTTGNIRVHPNPNSGAFTISGTLSNRNDERILVTIVNTVGQVIFRTSLPVENGVINSQLQLDGSLPGGMYNVIVRQGEMKLSYFIVKEQ
jgi:hypothetical protein